MLKALTQTEGKERDGFNIGGDAVCGGRHLRNDGSDIRTGRREDSKMTQGGRKGSLRERKRKNWKEKKVNR